MIYIAGVDEAGRGPLAGPVVAAAVIFDINQPIAGLADSKKLSAKKREALFDIIQEKALAFAVAFADEAEIDTHNIFQASLLAMQRAVQQLTIQPTEILVDGTHCPRVEMPARAIIKGDSLIPEISAASILAKVTRDRWMCEQHELYPHYNFAKHKGYPTVEHVAALKKYGVLPIHRRSFRPVRELCELTNY